MANNGDKVRLTKAAETCVEGCEGIVTHVDARGNMTVAIKTKPSPGCEPFNWILTAYPPDYFDSETQCL